uniref:DUF4268 domain-containing protein n=1 Tax=uncultured Altererythrobacter sp. TaxID=500840 RepID=UPI0026257D5F|nr:DUF4268 domain-containing protein [uncultured Altererythrobacter sp.]
MGPFKADILAKRTDTADDHWVLIENQLERTDHKHLGQLLTYAAGLDAVTIVWVAESFAEEHQKTLEWLNEMTSDELEFFGLEIELWRIGDSPPAPMFNIVAEPNDWSREVKQAAGAQVSELKQQQRRFWQGLRSKLIEKNSKVKPQKAHPQHWAWFAIGRSNVVLSASLNSQKKFVWVNLGLMGQHGKAWFYELLERKDEIEAKIGEPLDWQELKGRKESRIALILENADPTDEEDWTRQQAWMIEKLERFYDVFHPLATSLSDPIEAPDVVGNHEANED